MTYTASGGALNSTQSNPSNATTGLVQALLYVYNWSSMLRRTLCCGGMTERAVLACWVLLVLTWTPASWLSSQTSRHTHRHSRPANTAT